MAEDDTTKLIIFGLGITVLTFFAYLLFRDFTRLSPGQYGFMSEASLNKQGQQQLQVAPAESESVGKLELIEEKLSQLETKFDNFVKTEKMAQSQSKPAQPNQGVRKSVSLKSMGTNTSSKPGYESYPTTVEMRKMSRDIFGML